MLKRLTLQPEAARQSLSIAVVGLGGIGGAHSVIVNNVPGSKLAAVCDTDKRLIRLAQGALPHISAYSDFQKLLAEQDIDGVFVCTPAHTHLDLVKDALAAPGVRGIFLEKPMAPTYSTALELTRLCLSRRIVTMVGLQRRFIGSFREAKRALEAGEIGTPLAFRAWHLSDGTMQEGKGWRFHPLNGGVTLEWGVHLFGMLNWLFGRPNRVSAVRRRIVSRLVEDYSHVDLDYASGLTGSVDIGWSLRLSSPPDMTVEIHGTSGYLRVTEDRIILATGEPTSYSPVGKVRVFHSSLLNESVPFLFGRTEMVAQDALFVQSISGGNAPPNSFDEVAPIHEVIDRVKAFPLV